MIRYTRRTGKRLILKEQADTPGAVNIWRQTENLMDRGEDSEMVSSAVTSWTRLDLEPKTSQKHLDALTGEKKK